MNKFTDLLIHISPRQPGDDHYPIAVTVDDADPLTERLRLDLGELAAAEQTLDAAVYGLDLFDKLFSGKVRRAYDRAVGMAQPQAGQLRVRLWIDTAANELHAVPWERLYHSYENKTIALAATGKTPFSRYIGVEGRAAPPAIDAPPIKLLFALANPRALPAGLPPIDGAAQVRSLQQALRELRRDGRFQITVMPGQGGLAPLQVEEVRAAGFTLVEGPTTLDALVARLPDFHILHLLAHGSFVDGQSWLHLEQDNGTWARCPAALFVDKVGKLTRQPHLIFLAACESAKTSANVPNAFVGLAPQLVQAGIPAVIAMQEQVTLDDAQQLTGAFYRLLLEHGLVDQALNEARNLLFRPNSFDWAIPALFMRLRQGRLLAEAEKVPTQTIPVPPVAPPATFGRQIFLDQLVADLNTLPLIALRGSAGVGKSHLALALANHPAVVNAFPDGRAWLELGPAADRFAALGHLLGQLGGSAEAAKTETERAALLRTLLAGRRLLLLLDDVWAVADAKPFLDGCQLPTCVVLTTRSAQLAADLHAANHEVPVLDRPPAVALLAAAGADAAQAVALDPAGTDQLAAQLGDLPLALHVAGRHLNKWAHGDGAAGAVAQLAADLATQTAAVLQLRAASPRPGLADAQPTLEAVLDLSYRALPLAAQQALRQLAVFGPQPWHFDAAAMQAVWQLRDPSDARERRASLVDAGLLMRLPATDQATGDTGPRYALHQVVTAFAAARLAQDATAEQTAHLAHAAHYANVVANWDAAIDKGQMSYAAPHEWENVARAVEWLAPRIATDDEAAAALLAFTRYWRNVLFNNYDPRRTRWLALGVAAAQRANAPGDLANTLKAQGDVYRFLKRNDEALAVYAQALGLYRTVGSRLGEANTLKAQGDVYAFLKRNDEALAVYAQALGLYRTVGSRLGEANTLQAQGDVYAFLKRNDEALAVYAQALGLYRTVGDRLGEANTLQAQGDVYRFLKRNDEALAVYAQALGLYRTVGSRLGEANTLKAQGDVYRFLKRNDEALAIYAQALGLYRTVGDRLGEANTLQAQGDVYAFLKRNDEALAVYAQALGLYRTVGDRVGEANTLQAQGDVYRFLDRNDEALAVYAQALGLYRTVGSRLGEANTLQAQGDAALRSSEIERGLTLLDAAFQLYAAIGARTGTSNVGIILARNAARQHEWEAAIRYMQPAADFGREIGHPLGDTLQAEIDDWQIQLRFAALLAYQKAEDWTTLVGAAESLIAQGEGNDQVWALLADARSNLDDEAGAMDAYAQAVALQPDSPLLRRNYANTLIHLGRLDEAAAQLAAAAALEPNAAYLALRRAELAKARDDRIDAQHWAQEALQRQPDWDEAQAILDWVDESRGS